MVGDRLSHVESVRRWRTTLAAFRERPRALLVCGASLFALVLFVALALSLFVGSRFIAWGLLIAIGVAEYTPGIFGGWQAHGTIVGLTRFLIVFVPLWLSLELLLGVVVAPAASLFAWDHPTQSDDGAGRESMTARWVAAVRRGLRLALARIVLSPLVWALAFASLLVGTTIAQYVYYLTIGTPGPVSVILIPIPVALLSLWLARLVVTAPVAAARTTDPAAAPSARTALTRGWSRFREDPRGVLREEAEAQGIPLVVTASLAVILASVAAFFGSETAAVVLAGIVVLTALISGPALVALYRTVASGTDQLEDVPVQESATLPSRYSRIGRRRLAMVALVLVALVAGSVWVRHADVRPTEDDGTLPAVNASQPDQAVVAALERTRAVSYTAVRRHTERPIDQSGAWRPFGQITYRVDHDSGRTRGTNSYLDDPDTGYSNETRWVVISMYTSETVGGAAFTTSAGRWPESRPTPANWTLRPTMDPRYPLSWLTNEEWLTEHDWRLADRTADSLVFETANASRGSGEAAADHRFLRTRVTVDRSTGRLRHVVRYTRDRGFIDNYTAVHRTTVVYSDYETTHVRRPAGSPSLLEHCIDQLMY